MRYLKVVLSVIILMALTTCKKDNCQPQPDNPTAMQYYAELVRPVGSVEGLTWLEVPSYQQTTEYTCGPAAVVSLLHYHHMQANEMQIATEMQTSQTVGTNPHQMTEWLNSNGFEASWHENGSLEMLQQNLSEGKPILVEWSDWGGHWVLVIGYDIRNPDDLMDDVIIFADPYDRHDDHQDGFTWFNAQRFYYMWYDALLFDSVMRRVYISAVPLN